MLLKIFFKNLVIISTVWIFNGCKASFPSGVFSSQELAEAWILQNQLTGILTEYPVDAGVFDWAVENGYFSPKRPEHHEAGFIQGFTSAVQAHAHYENGVRAS